MKTTRKKIDSLLSHINEINKEETLSVEYYYDGLCRIVSVNPDTLLSSCSKKMFEKDVYWLLTGFITGLKQRDGMKYLAEMRDRLIKMEEARGKNITCA